MYRLDPNTGKLSFEFWKGSFLIVLALFKNYTSRTNGFSATFGFFFLFDMFLLERFLHRNLKHSFKYLRFVFYWISFKNVKRILWSLLIQDKTTVFKFLRRFLLTKRWYWILILYFLNTLVFQGRTKEILRSFFEKNSLWLVRKFHRKQSKGLLKLIGFRDVGLGDLRYAWEKRIVLMLHI